MKKGKTSKKTVATQTARPLSKSWLTASGVSLLLVLLLSAVLRLWQLGVIPNVLNRDEAALAYNAFLLKETGTDEWGQSWPLALESFGDYKLPGYPLLLIGFFTFFGLSDWVVRLPSVIAGVVLVALTYGVGRQLGWTKLISLSVASLVAITPVFIFYSRVAFEANVGLALFVASWLLLLLPNGKSSALVGQKYRWLSDTGAILIMLAGIFTYNTPFLLLPFMMVVLPVLRGLKKWQLWWWPTIGLCAVFMVGVLVLLPITTQKSGITIFSDETVWRNSVVYYEQFSGLAQKVLGNKYVYFAQLIFKNYLASISPYFLVVRGGTHPWHQITGGGHLGWLVYGLGWMGFATILLKLFKKVLSPEKVSPLLWLPLYWAFIGLLPAVITVDAPHATRSLFFFWSWILLAGVGIAEVLNVVRAITHSWRTTFIKPIVILSCLLLFGISFETGQYLYRYFVIFQANQIMWKPGYQVALQQVERDRPTDPVAVVDPDGYHYILTAWYLKLPATQYFETVVRQQPNQIGFKYGQQVDRWHFIADPNDRQDSEKAVVSWQDDHWQVDWF